MELRRLDDEGLLMEKGCILFSSFRTHGKKRRYSVQQNTSFFHFKCQRQQVREYPLQFRNELTLLHCCRNRRVLKMSPNFEFRTFFKTFTRTQPLLFLFQNFMIDTPSSTLIKCGEKFRECCAFSFGKGREEHVCFTVQSSI